MATKGLSDRLTEHEERVTAAHRAWCGGAEPVPAEAPSWPEDSLGGRFLGGFHLKGARNAPSLLTADVPDAAVIRADPAHWNVAAEALVRAIVYDGLSVDHPAVSALLDALAPAAEAELAYGEVIESPLQQGYSELDVDDFPEDDGPVMLIGGFALVDATWALVGTDSLGAVLPVLRSAAEEALPDLDAGAVADALMGAFSRHYQCDQRPGDAEILDRIGRDVPGDALEHLVGTGVVPFGDVLRAGLLLLSALTKLCMKGAASILDEPPEHAEA